MTGKEKKELLLQDLSARLPYRVKASYYGGGEERETLDEIEGITIDGYVDIGPYSLPVERITPYLIPLSSMTEEQKVIYGDLCYDVIRSLPEDTQTKLNELVVWLNKNYLDYRGLIPMGLANDATGLNLYKL